MTNEKSTALVARTKMESFLATMKPRIAKVLPKHLTPERMGQIVMVEASRNPKLAECTVPSLAAAVMLASELGLEPSGPLGKFYLIPRNLKVKGTNRKEMTCTPLIGYKGLAQLARNSGEIARLNASVVFKDEIDSGAFTATIEPPDILHKFTPVPINRHPDEIALAYATAEMKDGSKAQVILTRSEVEDRRSRSSSGDFGPWTTDFGAMARKTALRALLTGGLVPLAAESSLTRAVEAELSENIVAQTPSGSASDDTAPIVDFGAPTVEVVDETTGEVTEAPADAVTDESGAAVEDPPEASDPEPAAKPAARGRRRQTRELDL
ncbi:hypothetical protein HN937_28280 [Candidatus Poribacteria bacterium]|nr:hypothetical protein [Candidatus Poribacteria bacterium]